MVDVKTRNNGLNPDFSCNLHCFLLSWRGVYCILSLRLRPGL